MKRPTKRQRRTLRRGTKATSTLTLRPQDAQAILNYMDALESELTRIQRREAWRK